MTSQVGVKIDGKQTDLMDFGRVFVDFQHTAYRHMINRISFTEPLSRQNRNLWHIYLQYEKCFCFWFYLSCFFRGPRMFHYCMTCSIAKKNP